ncbi:hypothetical protein SEA_BILLNYE_200 [Streptomyces phage BillNye]|uniref:Uncharacterized protein n=1 Tax=Streptomyces phage BillNye TaxID=2079426 RepID=A0A2L1IW00_9CAUD|nr:hypothetical protein FDJ30_gp061 [Streptomyces phage BillNye]AVD99372.1 hypothetical protein SEA_BILLNYE_200 [Streptomyces phage BillNye]
MNKWLAKHASTISLFLAGWFLVNAVLDAVSGKWSEFWLDLIIVVSNLNLAVYEHEIKHGLLVRPKRDSFDYSK